MLEWGKVQENVQNSLQRAERTTRLGNTLWTLCWKPWILVLFPLLISFLFWVPLDFNLPLDKYIKFISFRIQQLQNGIDPQRPRDMEDSTGLTILVYFLLGSLAREFQRHIILYQSHFEKWLPWKKFNLSLHLVQGQWGQVCLGFPSVYVLHFLVDE